jgi:hypothetical protein
MWSDCNGLIIADANLQLLKEQTCTTDKTTDTATDLKPLQAAFILVNQSLCQLETLFRVLLGLHL